MSSLEELFEKAREMRLKGMSTDEIARELNIQRDTAIYLMTRRSGEVVRKKTNIDFFVNLNTIYASGTRLKQLGGMLADYVAEAIKGNLVEDPEVVVGVELRGVPLATMVADILSRPLGIARKSAENRRKGEDESTSWFLSSSFSDVSGKKVIVIDDVVTSGRTIKNVARMLREKGCQVTAIFVVMNKGAIESAEGVPIKSLFSIIPFEAAE